ncbi:signal recognition particle 14 kDa protein [Pectinophora gossypiella]|uniref:signal recognition particle 14 kDa protein n=1 Tax=Pectinophora gossypiella TaxID=13191 RepID=UPI00214E2829|nr:signal recognition particle 14 kDa protein [Pectinophora gossypiella]XP_049877499.1 signal recognition particle 14 kDa protein [Pectinophora gossypiella]
MVLLNNDEFLAELTKLFQKARAAGSVTMTMKRYDGRTKPQPRDGTPAVKNPEYKCLIRAQSSSKKISTVVEQNNVERFSTAYSNLLKTSVNGLKRLKKPKKKAMATQ